MHVLRYCRNPIEIAFTKIEVDGLGIGSGSVRELKTTRTLCTRGAYTSTHGDQVHHAPRQISSTIILLISACIAFLQECRGG